MSRPRLKLSSEERTRRKVTSYLLKNARWRSARKRLPYALTKDWLAGKLRRGVCEVTGVKLRLGSTRPTPWSPSIDRIVASRGYVPGNCRLVAYGFNVVRASAPDDRDATKFIRSVVSIQLAK